MSFSIQKCQFAGGIRFCYARLQSKRCRSSQCTRVFKVYAYTEKKQRSKYRQQGAHSNPSSEPLYVEVQEDGSDSWRLEPVIELLKNGGVGIIPTDSYPALVCSLNNLGAVQRLYNIKDISPKKPLSILCKDFRDINKYTLGFPAANLPGQQDMFRIMKQVLPGPYTIILPASKEMPKQVLDGSRHKTKSRKQVGVRMPNDFQELLVSQLDWNNIKPSRT
eukprot:TRINITY_DN9565_c1_g1_i2.p2 TRINITY_DN9565_c1_g1~~TRINITY_DN9565_c1_g1_i2.p2  ORF type:complete len:220 (-),score=2.65 TRINITY_DN9565_c1_g1_i2:16-675(-)